MFRLRPIGIPLAHRIPPPTTKGPIVGADMDKVTGRIKQAAGDLTGDDELEREGELDEASGEAKEKIDEIAGKVSDKVDEFRGRIG